MIRNFLLIYMDLKDKTMADKLIYILNKYNSNYPFCRLQLMVEKFCRST